MFLRKMIFKYVTFLMSALMNEINFWLEMAKTCRLFLDECINYLVATIITCNIYLMV